MMLNSMKKGRPCKVVHGQEILSWDDEGNEYKQREFVNTKMTEKKLQKLLQNSISVIERKKFQAMNLYPYPFKKIEVYSVTYVFVM